MSRLQKAMQAERELTTSVLEMVREKGVSSDAIDSILGADSMFGAWQATAEQARAKEQYSQFKGWVYAAVHAIASEGALQDLNVAKKNKSGKKGSLPFTKSALETVPHHFRKAAVSRHLSVQPDHPLHECMVTPNPLQDGIGFVYSFIANLCLTGWGYIIGGPTGDEECPYEFYSVPTTWIIPDHNDGPFSKFWIKDPANPQAKAEPLPREVVAFAHLPNPADMKGATAPAGAQIQAIKIDDHIQTSQEQFFENGVFPSVIVEMGKDPHPDIPAGIRPRLSPSQRRQVMGAIRKVMGGVANYGSPAIIDGLIENIRPLSWNSREMGWDKSEDKARTRILVAFGTHPYILGEPTNIGGYAQAAKIEERFCKRVNLFLRMLSGCMTGLVHRSEPLVVWWEACAANDPQLRWKNLLEMRKNGDLTQDEIREAANFPEAEPGALKVRNKLLDSVGGMQGTIATLQAVGRGEIGPEAAVLLLITHLEIEEEIASRMVEAALEKTEEQEEMQQQPQPGAPAPEDDEDDEEEQEEEENGEEA